MTYLKGIVKPLSSNLLDFGCEVAVNIKGYFANIFANELFTTLNDKVVPNSTT